MKADTFINILATVTLVEMMVTIGLGVKVADLIQVSRNRGLVVRAVLANYVAVPAAAMALLMLFHAKPMVSAGFLIAAVCPGAPYGPPFTAIAKGKVTVSVGLMAILAGSSAVVAPVLLMTLLPITAGDQAASIHVVKMVGTLVVSQFLPLCVGLFLRERRPAMADKLTRPFRRLSTLLNLVLVTTIIVVQFRMLTEIRLFGYLGMFALLVSTVIAGWVFGSTNRQERTAMVFATAVRNVGVSLVIATASFPGTAAITATTAYAVFQTVTMALVAVVWGQWAGTKIGSMKRMPA